MLALVAIDDLHSAEGIHGGPVAWLHDEIVLEVPIDNAKRNKSREDGAGSVSQTFTTPPFR